MKKWIIFVIVLGLQWGMQGPLQAQCSMCRAQVESGLNEEEHRSHIADGLNRGVVYLLFIPYISLAIVAWVWYKQRIRLRRQLLRLDRTDERIRENKIL